MATDHDWVWTKGMADVTANMKDAELRDLLTHWKRWTDDPVGYFQKPGNYNPARMAMMHKLKRQAYKPSVAGGWKPTTGEWVKNYWNWLAEGAKTRTARPEQEMAAGHEGTRYLTDYGWATRHQLDPESEKAKYIKAKTEAAELDTGDPQKYWEGWTAPAGWDYTPHYDWTQIENRPLWETYQGGWPGMILSDPTYNPPVTPTPTPPAPITPDTWPPLIPRWGTPSTRNVNINFGGGNREGNAATVGAPGTVSRTPGGTFYWGDGFMQQARERAAKRTGRRLSRAGVTGIPTKSILDRYRKSYLGG